jgi:hypothetical protein
LRNWWRGNLATLLVPLLFVVLGLVSALPLFLARSCGPLADGAAFFHHATIILAPTNPRVNSTPLVRADFLDLSRLFVSPCFSDPSNKFSSLLYYFNYGVSLIS